jgi:AraC-like DNA-binding protein
MTGSQPSLLSTMGVAARQARRRLVSLGFDADALARRCGVPQPWTDAPGQRIPVHVQDRLLDEAAALADDSLFGFHLALDLDPKDGAVVYYVCSNAQDVRSVLRTLERYVRIANEVVRLRTSVSPDGMELTVGYAASHRPSPQFTLFCVTLVVKLLRDLTGRLLRPTAVALRHPQPSGTKELRAYFGCPVSSSAAETRVGFPPDVAALRTTAADQRLYAVLADFAERLLAERTEGEDSLLEQVETAVLRRLPDSTCSIGEVARDLGLSARTFTRRLAAKGLRFSDVVDNVRRDLARRYLGDPRLTIQQIAFLLGYSEPSAFAHAFRRWTGTSPRLARRAS